jgi:hypothetical protein
LNQHGQLEKLIVEKTPVRKIVASFATGELIGGKVLPFDGMVELYFDTINDKDAFYECEMHKSGMMRKDEVNFADVSETPVRVIMEEYLMAEKTPGNATSAGNPGGPPAIKVVRTSRRREGLTLEDFKREWLTSHGPLEKMIVEKTPMSRIVTSFAIGEIGGKEPPFDGLTEFYFDTLEDKVAYYSGRTHTSGFMRKDDERFIDYTEEAVRVVTEEYVTAEKP